MSDSAYCGLSEKSCKQCDVSNGLFERFAEMQKKQILTDIILTSSDGKRFFSIQHEIILDSIDKISNLIFIVQNICSIADSTCTN